MKSKYILRPEYTERILPFIGQSIIKVITGQRRVGKSFLMNQLMDIIRGRYPNANIIYINRELDEFFALKSNIELSQYIREKLSDKTDNFLFIDEVQEIEAFQYTLRSLLAEGLCDIYCTGSNAGILSGELATFLGGRYVEIGVHSLNYREFLLFHRLEDSSSSLIKYLTLGGMPYLSAIGLNEDIAFEYLKNVYSSILLKDVVARENIRNVTFLQNLVTYLAQNTGNLFSSLNISNYLKSQHISMSPQLVINYVKALSNAYFVHKVVRSEIGGLKIFEIGEKYYFEDLGLRNVVIGSNKKQDFSRLMENAVYLHLLSSGYQVTVGKLGTSEIDFVAEKSGNKVYIQVCLQLSSEEIFQREFGNLMKIQDSYPKIVVTLNDPGSGRNHNGIKLLNLNDFLLKYLN